MASLSASADTVRRNLTSIERRVAAACDRAGRDPSEVTVCAATKYVDAPGMKALREAGVAVAAENRLQDMIVKQELFRSDFEWHFIGHIQSRKAAQIAERVSTIHSLASESVRERLNGLQGVLPRVLVQVNVSGEDSKDGVAPRQMGDFLSKCDFEVAGLMTMPPLAHDPEQARPHFKRLAEIAADHELAELSMGTSQDFETAIEEGATLIRVGSVLFAP